jgi:hypothetical protein
MLIEVDSEVPAKVLSELTAMAGIRDAKAIRLT